MSSVFAKKIGVILVPLLGCALCSAAGAQDVSDQSIEFLDAIEIADTLTAAEDRKIRMPIAKPDTTTLVPLSDKPLSGLMDATIARTSFVPQGRPKPILFRDAIADRMGLWQTVAPVPRTAERRISLAALDTTSAVPFNGLPAATIAKASIAPQERPEPEPPRDAIADRKALRKTVRLIKSERPPYPQAARRAGWEGTVVLRITVGTGGGVEHVVTQKSTGFDALDESAMESVKRWQFDPAKDGEFPVSAVVDLPIRFDLDEYGIQFSKEEPEPEPEPEPIKEKKPARLVKSERPPYPQEARKQGWEGTVLLRITVGTGGDVENVKIRESSGFPELDESAAQSVKTWRFDPAKEGDDPISSAVDLPVRFDLEEYKEETSNED